MEALYTSGVGVTEISRKLRIPYATIFSKFK